MGNNNIKKINQKSTDYDSKNNCIYLYLGDADNGDGSNNELMDEDPIDPFDLADPVDITAKLPGNFYELMVNYIYIYINMCVRIYKYYFNLYIYKIKYYCIGFKKMARTT